jgi:hypothetical protein
MVSWRDKEITVKNVKHLANCGRALEKEGLNKSALLYIIS